MTDFDKLIKEKAEQAEYAYKPSAWRNFKRVSGSASPLRYWIVGSMSAVVLGGAVATAILCSPKHRQAEIADAPVVAVDSTLVDAQPIAGDPDTVLYVSKEAPVQSVSPSRKKVSDNAKIPDVEAVAPERKPVEVKPKTENPVRLGRPLVIDVDTIKENVPTDEQLRNGHSRLF